MKKVVILVFLLSASFISFSQAQYEVSNDGEKILKGILSRELISKDTSFKWFAQNQQGYSPKPEIVAALKKKGYHFIVFGGTWCDDTKFILPKFYSIIDAAGISDKEISLFGVDRNKKTLGYLSESLSVINVPTFIILKDGKEIGRVVEFGKTGQWDKEIADIIDKDK